MSTRWLVAFGVLIVVGVAAILLAPGSPTHVAVESVAIPVEGAAPGAVSNRQEVAASPETGAVRISRLILDFGDVPILFPSTEVLHLVNRGGGPLEVRKVSLDGPFRAERSDVRLNPNVSTRFAVVFDPKKPGVYEQRLRLTLGDDTNPAVQDVEVLVRGRAVLSPQAAGVAIPPRPDEAIRRYQQERYANQLEEAQAAAESQPWGEEEDSPAGEVWDPDDEAVAINPDGGPGSPAPAHPRSPDQLRMAAMAVAAFGEEAGPDLNDVPVPVGEGQTVPDLPPAGDDDDAAGDDDHGEGTAGDDSPIDDNEGEDDKKAPEEEDEEDDQGAGLFTIAPNSSVLVYSSEAAMAFQAHRITVSPNGTLVMDGRMHLPELAFAFGQSISLEQWGHLTGTLAPDGTVVMTMVLRINDFNGSFIDLPMQLTTGMAVGYSAAGRMFFANGIPRDSLTGNVKMVGITNIPMGSSSSIEKAPVYFELLARIQL